jgi:hypothetical protein
MKKGDDDVMMVSWVMFDRPAPTRSGSSPPCLMVGSANQDGVNE